MHEDSQRLIDYYSRLQLGRDFQRILKGLRCAYLIGVHVRQYDRVANFTMQYTHTYLPVFSLTNTSKPFEEV